MNNPYQNLPPEAFWRRSVSGIAAEAVDPVTAAPFNIGRNDLIATAGSCFAQHISRMLVREGFRYLVTEPECGKSCESNQTTGIFSARFGNIYTVRQLLQLFDRAYGLLAPIDSVWTRPDGAFVDPFRPHIEPDGFASPDALASARRKHLSAVRHMFQECNVLIFTLGLTEGWVAREDGAVVPLAPGVAGGSARSTNYEFENFAVDGMIRDMLCFIDKLRAINTEVRLILTVSPVPLIATYEKRHVLVSNTYSKSALRVLADIISRSRPNVAYFPSFEIITGIHQRSRFYADDLREVTADGVTHVMSLFKKHYLGAEPTSRNSTPRKSASRTRIDDATARLDALNRVICEEELIDPFAQEPGAHS